MTALNCFIVFSDLRIRCRLLLNICFLRDASGCILLVEPQLGRLVLLILLLQSADFISAFLDGRFPKITDFAVLDCFLLFQCEKLSKGMEDNLLNIHLRKAPANRTVCVSVVDRVNALEVSNASLVLSACHSTFTVTAADESLERIVMLLARGIPSSASNDLLSKLKVFLADNSFMRSFYDNRLIDNTLF